MTVREAPPEGVEQKVLDRLRWHTAKDTAEVIYKLGEAGDDRWHVFTFLGGPKRNSKAALYGRSRALKAEGIDAMVRQYGAHMLVLIARSYPYAAAAPAPAGDEQAGGA